MKKLITLMLALLTLASLLTACASSTNEGEVVDIAAATATPAAETPTPAAPEEPTPTPTPEPEKVEVYTEKLAAATEANPDTIGYIAIESTNIDYPIMNSRQYKVGKSYTYFYNDHDSAMNEAASGSIYAVRSEISQNIAVTGHNSRVSGTMFHELHHIYDYNKGEKECAYRKCDDELTDVLPKFSADTPWEITVSFGGEEHTYRAFSVYQTKAGCDIYETLYDNVWWEGEGKRDYSKTTKEKVQVWIDKQLKNSEFDFGTEVTTDDNFLTLYTCGTEKADADKNARLYMFFKRVD